jgi:hypothetical protein
MSSADSKPPSDTRSRHNWYFCNGSVARGARRLAREMSTRHVLASSACATVIIVIGLCVVAVSRTGAAGVHDISWTDDRAISPDAMQRARGVKDLPILKIEDMTLVFSSR